MIVLRTEKRVKIFSLSSTHHHHHVASLKSDEVPLGVALLEGIGLRHALTKQERLS